MQSFSQFLKQPLNEATYDISQDVDWIFNKYFKKIFRELRKGNPQKQPNFITTSVFFKSKPCKEAHNKAMLMIRGSSNGDTYYSHNPTHDTIYISLPLDNIEILEYYQESSLYIGKVSLKTIAQLMLHPDDRKQWLDSFTDANMKAKIRHEIVHWLDNVLHNRFLDTAKLPTSLKNINSSSWEINAVLNSILEFKRTMSQDAWDKLTFEELTTYPALQGSKQQVEKVGEYPRWKKIMLKRLAREKLLGKNMRYSS